MGDDGNENASQTQSPFGSMRFRNTEGSISGPEGEIFKVDFAFGGQSVNPWALLNEEDMDGIMFSGEVLKLSNHLKNWNPRFMMIHECGKIEFFTCEDTANKKSEWQIRSDTEVIETKQAVKDLGSKGRKDGKDEQVLELKNLEGIGNKVCNMKLAAGTIRVAGIRQAIADVLDDLHRADQSAHQNFIKNPKVANLMHGAQPNKMLDKLGMHTKEVETFASQPKAYQQLGLFAHDEPNQRLSQFTISSKQSWADSMLARKSEGAFTSWEVLYFSLQSFELLWFRNPTDRDHLGQVAITDKVRISPVACDDRKTHKFGMSIVLVPEDAPIILAAHTEAIRDTWIRGFESCLDSIKGRTRDNVQQSSKVKKLMFGKHSGNCKASDRLGVSEKELKGLQLNDKDHASNGTEDTDVTGVELRSGIVEMCTSGRLGKGRWKKTYASLFASRLLLTDPMATMGSMTTVEFGASGDVRVRKSGLAARFTVEITTKKQQYFLAFDTAKSRDEWFDLIASNALGGIAADVERCSGYVFKMGSVVKSWRRRWLKLYSNGDVAYFKKKSEGAEISRIALTRETEIKSIDAKAGYPTQFAFCLHAKPDTRVYIFTCDNDEERQAWIEQMEKVCRTLKTNAASDSERFSGSAVRESEDVVEVPTDTAE